MILVVGGILESHVYIRLGQEVFVVGQENLEAEELADSQ